MKWLPLKTALGILIILAYFLVTVPAFADPGGRPEDLYEEPPIDTPNEGGDENTNSGDNEGAEQDEEGNWVLDIRNLSLKPSGPSYATNSGS